MKMMKTSKPLAKTAAKVLTHAAGAGVSERLVKKMSVKKNETGGADRRRTNGGRGGKF